MFQNEDGTDIKLDWEDYFNCGFIVMSKRIKKMLVDHIIKFELPERKTTSLTFNMSLSDISTLLTDSLIRFHNSELYIVFSELINSSSWLSLEYRATYK